LLRRKRQFFEDFMNSKGLSVAAVLFPILIMSALAGYRWHTTAPTQPATTAGKNAAKASDCPMFGGSPSRNMVNLIDKNPPFEWHVGDPDKKIGPKNIKWSAELGDHCYAGPVIADGKVFVGTNNRNPRDKKLVNANGVPLTLAVLMCFAEADGKFLWQITHELPDHPAFEQARPYGLFSTPTIEDKRVYYTTPGCVVVCADTSGKVVWTYDMMKELKVVPHHAANCAPLIVGDLVMVISGNGVDDEGKVVSPKAPSFVAINKKTGVLAWQSSLPGANIIEGQWSNPTLATVNGKQQVVFAGGDAYVYGLEPDTGNMIWKCNCNPMNDKKGDPRKVENYIVSTPVVVGDRLYVGLGTYPEHPGPLRNFGFALCIDITKKGDVSPKSFDVKDPANKNSALVWALGGPIDPPPEKGRQQYLGRTTSTAAVHDGLVYLTESDGYMHCLDAKTGKRYWDHDFKAGIWGSAYVVDNKVFVAVDDGDVMIFAHGKERKCYVGGNLKDAPTYRDVKAAASIDDAVHTGLVVANGTLYIATVKKLYAIANSK
jgi:outer membrane protein assembly factor BamB